MAKQESSTKSCVACGLRKPLSAFLQIAGAQGTTYGNVCATCRGSSAGKKITIPHDDTTEEGSSSTGLRIDAKTKIQIDTETAQHVDDLENLAQKESKKRQTIQDDGIERTSLKEETEKKHRTNYLEPRKKEGFLNYQRQKLSSKEPSSLSQIRNTELSNKQTVINQQQHEREATAAHEEKIKNVNLSDAYVDPTQAGELKFQSAEFLKVKAWLGSSAAISTYERQFLAKKNASAEPASEKKSGKDPLVEFIDNTWETPPKNPGSRRR